MEMPVHYFYKNSTIWDVMPQAHKFVLFAPVHLNRRGVVTGFDPLEFTALFNNFIEICTN
jgi:hypothetical protein